MYKNNIMRKIIVNALLLLSLSVVMISCETTKKEAPQDNLDTTKKVEQENKAEGHEHDDVAGVVYQCPMKCEADKTYSEPGSCPVCKMDLKEVAAADVESSEAEEESPE